MRLRQHGGAPRGAYHEARVDVPRVQLSWTLATRSMFQVMGFNYAACGFPMARLYNGEDDGDHDKRIAKAYKKHGGI